MADLECPYCNHPFEEPERTRAMECPKCGGFIFVPTHKDWQALHDHLESLEEDKYLDE